MCVSTSREIPRLLQLRYIVSVAGALLLMALPMGDGASSHSSPLQGSCLSLEPPCSVPLKSTQPFKQDRRQFTYTEPRYHGTSFDFRNTESSSQSQLSHFLQPESSEPADFSPFKCLGCKLDTSSPMTPLQVVSSNPLCHLLLCVWLWEEWNEVLRDSQ